MSEIGPHEEWVYRETTCRIYVAQTPDGARYLGYVKFGDEWLEVVDAENTRTEDVKDGVERNVDRCIRTLVQDTEDGGGHTTVIDSQPCPQPYPIVDPNPNDWEGPFYDDTTTNVIEFESHGHHSGFESEAAWGGK